MWSARRHRLLESRVRVMLGYAETRVEEAALSMSMIDSSFSGLSHLGATEMLEVPVAAAVGHSETTD